jgi:TonB family protein
VILFVGPAFFNSKPKVDDSQVLDVIPANLIDAAFNSGVKGAQSPSPTPIVVPQPQPTLLTKLETYFKPEPKPDLNPVEKPEKTPPHKIEVNTQLVTRNSLKNSSTVKPKSNSQAAKNLAAELRSKLSSATTVDMPGESSVAYANYGTVVVSVYHNAWISPDDMANDSAVVKFSVTIAGDGTVINAHIIDPSGDANVDAAVQRMLNRVASIAPFPEGATEKERTYTINFNASRTSE